jgi:hypothetical protein
LIQVEARQVPRWALLPVGYARPLLPTPEGRNLAARQIKLLAACPVDAMDGDSCSGVTSFLALIHRKIGRS